MIAIAGRLLGLYCPPVPPGTWQPDAWTGDLLEIAWTGDLLEIATFPLRVFVDTKGGGSYVYEVDAEGGENFRQVPSCFYSAWSKSEKTQAPLPRSSQAQHVDVVSWVRDRIDLYVLLAVQHKIPFRAHFPGRQLLGMVTPMARPGFRWNARARVHCALPPRRGGLRARWRRSRQERSSC